MTDPIFSKMVTDPIFSKMVTDPIFSLSEFQAKMEEVRSLQAGLSSLTNFDNLESSLSELQRLLEESENE